jgi:hypothetical protein
MNMHPQALLQSVVLPVHVLYRDYETRSTIDLAKAGAWKYAAHPHTEVLCCAYAVDDEPPQIWTPKNPIPAVFVEAACDPAWLVVAHNAQFERAIEELLLHPRYGWPLVPILICFAYGALALIDVKRDLWIKEQLSLSPATPAGGLPCAPRSPLRPRRAA